MKEQLFDVSANIDIGKNITGLIEQLAHQIGTTADKLFPWYVKQQVIEGYSYMIISITVILIGIGIFLKSYFKADWDNENKYVPLTILGGVLMMAGFVAVVFGSAAAISQIINPEFYATRSIISDMSRLVQR